jgi:hypothetical protein
MYKIFVMLSPKEFYMFLGTLETLPKTIISFAIFVCPSVRLSAWNNSASTGPIFMKFDICLFLRNLSKKN